MNRYMEDFRGSLERLGLVRSQGTWLGAFALGAGIGIVAGAAIAMVFAPQSGAETRRQIGTRAKALADRTSGLIENAKGAASQKVMEAKEAVNKHGRNDVPVS